MKKNYLALGGLFACLHVIFLLASKFIVGSELILVLFLPLLSTIYTLKSDKKNVVMFVIATVLVCSIFDIVSTFIYIVPSLICGVLYGVLRKLNFKELELLTITTFGHMVSLLFSFLVITLLFKEVDFMKIFSSIFNVSGSSLFVVTLLVLLVMGYAEAFLVHVITDKELTRFTSSVEKNDRVPSWFLYAGLFCLVLSIVLYIFSDFYYVLGIVLLYIFTIPLIIMGIMNLKHKKLILALIFIMVIVSFIVLKYINTLGYIIIPLLIMSPFIIDNIRK